MNKTAGGCQSRCAEVQKVARYWPIFQWQFREENALQARQRPRWANRRSGPTSSGPTSQHARALTRAPSLRSPHACRCQPSGKIKSVGPGPDLQWPMPMQSVTCKPSRRAPLLQAVFEKSSAPTGEDRDPQRNGLVCEMAAAGEGHEKVGVDQGQFRRQAGGEAGSMTGSAAVLGQGGRRHSRGNHPSAG